jgi:SH3-like domain-containing protein
MLVNENIQMKCFTIILVIFFFTSSYAENIGVETGFELPRYVSLKSNDSNLRVGPSKNYPISIKYVIDNFPIQIIDEYKNWRKIIDFENNTGWIHKSLIKGERNGIINSPNKKNVAVFNTFNGKQIGEVTHGSIINLSKCKLNWCLIVNKNNSGWIEKRYIWGVKKNEVFNINFIEIFSNYFYKSINLFEKYIL